MVRYGSVDAALHRGEQRIDQRGAMLVGRGQDVERVSGLILRERVENLGRRHRRCGQTSTQECNPSRAKTASATHKETAGGEEDGRPPNARAATAAV